MTTLGSIGIGLMWGWLLLFYRTPIRGWRLGVTIATLMAATAVVAWQLFWFTDGQTLFIFLLAAAFSFIIHLSWQHSIRSQL